MPRSDSRKRWDAISREYSLLRSLVVGAFAFAGAEEARAESASEVAAGYSHTCAITTGGWVECWGRNEFGQIGNGGITQSPVPVLVSVLGNDVVEIAAGDKHTCALTDAGSVYCWGSNGSGRLGIAITTDQSSVPVAVSGLGSDVSAIAVGGAHSCALETDGEIWCWGSNDSGQLGNNSTISSSTPVKVNDVGSSFSALTAGTSHSCGVTALGGVWCWGYNGEGRLGNNSTSSSSVPVAVHGLSSGVASVAAGSSHTCVVTSLGGARCWGGNGGGWLGNGSSVPSSIPVDVSGLATGVATIAAGESHTCARLASGSVRCWGVNSNGQLGRGTTISSNVPIDVVGLGGNAIAIALGLNHTCAVTSFGSVRCWGDDFYGQIGNGKAAVSFVPIAVSGLGSGVVSVNAGGFHTCAVTAGGAARCWGANSQGALGTGGTSSRSVPSLVPGFESGVAAIAAGFSHTCAATTGGAAWCWGKNNFGNVGDGTTTSPRPAPVGVDGLATDVVDVGAGNDHSCALIAGGAVRCWGWNGSGQLGDGSNTDSSVPVTVDSIGNPVAAIALGAVHTCALTVVGGVKCWGSGANGRLGAGNNTTSSLPVDVAGLTSGVVSISAGEAHTCAITSGGAARCWGAGSDGRLGNGADSNSNIPVDVYGLSSGVEKISAGTFHTCALTTLGAVKCWGRNAEGELGTGEYTSSSDVPVDVSNLGSGIAAIDAGNASGGNHTCAVSTSGSVVCWGGNHNSELGNGYSPVNPSPRTVINFGGAPPPAVPVFSPPALLVLLTLLAAGGGVAAARRQSVRIAATRARR